MRHAGSASEMRQSLKIALSLLISLVLFSAVAVLSYLSLFRTPGSRLPAPEGAGRAGPAPGGGSRADRPVPRRATWPASNRSWSTSTCAASSRRATSSTGRESAGGRRPSPGWGRSTRGCRWCGSWTRRGKASTSAPCQAISSPARKPSGSTATSTRWTRALSGIIQGVVGGGERQARHAGLVLDGGDRQLMVYVLPIRDARGARPAGWALLYFSRGSLLQELVADAGLAVQSVLLLAGARRAGLPPQSGGARPGAGARGRAGAVGPLGGRARDPVRRAAFRGAAGGPGAGRAEADPPRRWSAAASSGGKRTSWPWRSARTRPR